MILRVEERSNIHTKHIRLQMDVDVNMSEYLLQVNKQYNALRIGNMPKEKRERSTWLLVRGWGTRARSIPFKKPEYS